MDIVGDRKFVEIPGDRTLELPPLLVSDPLRIRRIERVVDMAARLVEREDLVPALPSDGPLQETELDRRKFEMALNLVDMYRVVNRQWHWGDSVLEWIRQCEITFETKAELRRLLRPDVWPHAGRSSFVTLLEDKHVLAVGINLEEAVGLRLTFRHLPPLSDFSDQFLFYLNAKLAGTAYQTWATMSPAPISSLPPERFHVEVVTM